MKVATLIAVGLSAAFALHVVLSSISFCYDRPRILSDRELINAAIEQRLEPIRRSDPTRAQMLFEKVSSNPHCCFLERLTNVPSGHNTIFDKMARAIVGYNVSTVTLNFGPAPPGEVWDADYVVISSCGCVLD